MVRARALLVWATTGALLAAAAAGAWSLVHTGAPPSFVAAGVVALAVLAVESWRSGARFAAEDLGGRPLSGRDPPEIRRALLDVCERTGHGVPALVVVRMDVPGVSVGYGEGDPLVAVDPLLLTVVGPEGLRALFAHEFGHLHADIHTDAVREYLPQVVGFAAFWQVALAGRGPAVATAGSALYLALAPVRHRYALAARTVLSAGVEAVALAASRWANRNEELLADAYAASVVAPASLADALYRVAAVATGRNDEDVAGPVPWEADRPWHVALFATHPSIERRVEALGCAVPAWVRPYRPRTRD